MRRTQGLAHAALVGANDDVREVEHLGRAAIVLLEPHDVRVGKVLVEVEDVADVRPAPAVDRLIVVADDAEIAVAAREQLHELILRAVRVLVLVDEEIAELAAVLLQLTRILGEQPHRQDEQIVEVDGVGETERLAEIAVDDGDGARERIHREVRVLVGGDERVLRIGDRRVHAARGELLHVELVPLHDALHDGLRVVLIVDRERRRASDEVRCGAQHPRADGVERTHPHPRRCAPEEAGDAFLHLARGLVGERDGEDATRIDPVLIDEARDARREHARLARARTGEDQQRSIDVQHGLALRRVEPLEQRIVGRNVHQGKIISNVAPRSAEASCNVPP